MIPCCQEGNEYHERVPRRFEQGDAAAEYPYPTTPNDRYRQIYYEALDLSVCTIDSRFNQPGYKIYSCMEELLINVIQKKDCSCRADKESFGSLQF